MTCVWIASADTPPAPSRTLLLQAPTTHTVTDRQYVGIRINPGQSLLQPWVMQNINLTRTSPGVAQDHTCVQSLHPSRPSALPRVHPPRSHVRSRILLFDVSNPIVTTTVHLSNDTAAVCQKRPFLCARSQSPPPPACSADLALLHSSALLVSTCRVSAIPLFCCSCDCITSIYPRLRAQSLSPQVPETPRGASSQSRPVYTCTNWRKRYGLKAMGLIVDTPAVLAFDALSW